MKLQYCAQKNRILLGAMLGVILGCLGGVAFAQAALITFHFEGDVTSVSQVLSSQFNTTNKFTGSYTFDSLTPDRTPSTQVGAYVLTNASVTLAGNTYSALNQLGVTPPAITITSNSFGRPTNFALSDDSYRVSFRPSGPAVNELLPSSFNFTVAGLRQFPNDSLPLTPPSISSLLGSSTSINLSFVKPLGAVGGVTGELTSLTLAPVPLPGALVLFSSALFGVAGLEARRRINRT